MFADLNRDEINFIRITPDTTRHKEIMLPPNNSLAPNLLHLIFPAILCSREF